MSKVIKVYDKSSTGKKSQSSSVYSVEGICFTLMACTHGYAMGYILVENKYESDQNISNEERVSSELSSNVP